VETIPPDIIKEGDTPDHPRAVHQQIHGNGALLLRTARRYLMNGLDPIPHLKVAKAPPDSKAVVQFAKQASRQKMAISF
jgi:hypothetical protein